MLHNGSVQTAGSRAPLGTVHRRCRTDWIGLVEARCLSEKYQHNKERNAV